MGREQPPSREGRFADREAAALQPRQWLKAVIRDSPMVRRNAQKSRALDDALDLMLNRKSEAIRARMVEFLASEAKVSPVAVHIDARPADSQVGYIYTRPATRSKLPAKSDAAV